MNGGHPFCWCTNDTGVIVFLAHLSRDSPGSALTAVLIFFRFFPVIRKYTQRKLLRELLAAGFQGKMDFIYLPLDPRTRSSRGFAFCNFSSPQAEVITAVWWAGLNWCTSDSYYFLVPTIWSIRCKVWVWSNICIYVCDNTCTICFFLCMIYSLE